MELYFNSDLDATTARKTFKICSCSDAFPEPSNAPIDAPTIEYDTTCYHLKFVYQDSACYSSFSLRSLISQLSMSRVVALFHPTGTMHVVLLIYTGMSPCDIVKQGRLHLNASAQAPEAPT